MSLRRSWSQERSRLFRPSRSAAQAAPAVAAEGGRRRPAAQALVGRDFAREPARTRRPAGLLAGLVVGALVSALLATSLRVEILRLRYALGEAVREEAALLERTRALTVARRELRDPRHLRRLAEERGFVRPSRVIRLGETGENANAGNAAVSSGRSSR